MTSHDKCSISSSDPRVLQLIADLDEAGAATVSRAAARAVATPSASLAALLSDASFEKLHTGTWREVATCWRDLASLSALLAHACGAADSVRLLDLATLQGGDAFREEVGDALTEASRVKRHKPAQRDASFYRLGVPPAAPVPQPPGPAGQPVSRAHLPSLEAFLASMKPPGTPLLVTGMLESWPAVERWGDARYLLELAGERTVPVELGDTYLSEEYREELLSLGTFIHTHLLSPEPGAPRGYLAQHALLDQIPALRADVLTPDYCSLGGGARPALNAWLGPAGTVTPLHQDPQHNLLCQVIGRKRVRLYAPASTPALYPRPGRLSNSSRVDVLAPDAAAFPSFAAAPYLDCELRPGEALYIPPRWWHFVLAETSSFSVSFWWGDAVDA